MFADRAAAVVLTLTAAAPLIWIAVAFARSPYRPWHSVLYFVHVLLTRVLWRMQVPASLPVPSEQGAVLVCNHRSSVDPFFIQSAARRVVHWMVAREYCEHLAFGWFMRSVEVIPTRRGGVDTAATRQAIRLASSGELIGVLPEGRINVTDQFMLPARPGAALIALRARVPVVPCYIAGAPYDGRVWGPFLMRARVRVVIGEPIDVSEFFGREREEGVLQLLTLRFVREIARLAGRDDHQPQLAGRRWKPSGEQPQRELRDRSSPAAD